MRCLVFVLAGLVSLTASTAQAGDYKVGSLEVASPWSRATPKGATVAAGYMKITNTGTEPDRLVGGSSDVATSFQIHEMRMEKGVAKMRPLTKGLDERVKAFLGCHSRPCLDAGNYSRRYGAPSRFSLAVRRQDSLRRASQHV